MGEVIEFKRPAPPEPQESRIWECNCGSQLFYLNENGNCECALCKRISGDMICGLKYD